jgi:hypothetical protein
LLRATPAQWFEIVVATENATETMELLARRGQVQFEWAGERSAASRIEGLREPLRHYRALAAQFSDHWPAPVFETRSCMLPVEVAAEAAIQRIERWRAAAEPLLERLDQLRRERVELQRWRPELWRLLVLCGIAATGFGFVYGDVFGYHQWVPPLWIKPLEHPLDILLVPVVAGALVLTAGVLLHAVQTCWRGQGLSEGVADAAQLVVYWGVLLAFLDVRCAWLVAGRVTLCLGNRLWRERSLRVLLIGIGHQLQSTFALLINTLSFVRVGAFALAHSALESAIVTVADGIASAVASACVIVVGNLLIIVLEGLVVSIQTTRLVLFEFFMRFYGGHGRPFRPAPTPPDRGHSDESG